MQVKKMFVFFWIRFRDVGIQKSDFLDFEA